MATTSFKQFWRELEAEVEAGGPAAVAEFERMGHRFYLGGQLSVARARTNLTQKELATLTGIDQAEISRIERGVSNPTEETLVNLGSKLGLKLAFVPDREAITA